MVKMFNKLPHYVTINNEKCFINTDFRIFIDLEIEMSGKNQKEAVLKTLKRFYPTFLEFRQEDLAELVAKMIWFYKCGKDDIEIKHTDKTSSNLRIYDYEYDGELIWGAFKAQYNVELDSCKLHWWKFKAMWNSLSNDCEFSKIRSYRAYSGKDKELLKLKELYALPLSQNELDEQKRRDKIFENLNNLSASNKERG